MTRIRSSWLVVVILFVSACAGNAPPPALPQMPAPGAPVSLPQVQSILEQRCIVCHGCYDAPCQLLLSSNAGIERGASKAVVYQTDRLTAAAPTRLFIDAQSAAQWRERGFFSVAGDPAAPGSASLLFLMLELGRADPFAAGEKLPASVPLDINRKLSCPTLSEFQSYATNHPLGGMPYGMAPLSDKEFSTLVSWVAQGAPAPSFTPTLPATATAQIAHWETFLNGNSFKEQLTARYLYEHWFLAHFALEGLPAGPFFRIVRSKTPPGVAIDEIASRRPYDAPGVARFWYRLRPLEEAIVHKTSETIGGRASGRAVIPSSPRRVGSIRMDAGSIRMDPHLRGDDRIGAGGSPSSWLIS